MHIVSSFNLPIYEGEEVSTTYNQIHSIHYFDFLSSNSDSVLLHSSLPTFKNNTSKKDKGNTAINKKEVKGREVGLKGKDNKLYLNPAISKLKLKLEHNLNSKELNSINSDTILISYAKSILSFSLNEIGSKYVKIIDNPIAKCILPTEWNSLRKYKGLPGIYLFSNKRESYLGSSKNLSNRCYIQHKNKALTNKKILKNFYSSVVKNTWSAFTVSILELTPNHIELFTQLNPNYKLTKKEYEFLLDLTVSELTIAEQVYMYALLPSLNGSYYANWSTYNTGAKGYIREEESNIELSLSFLNRTYSQATIESHRKNRKGKKVSDKTRQKMSDTRNKRRSIILIDVNSEKEIVFETVASLSRELEISDRTINRWALDGKQHRTKSLKYPLIKIKIN